MKKPQKIECAITRSGLTTRPLLAFRAENRKKSIDLKGCYISDLVMIDAKFKVGREGESDGDNVMDNDGKVGVKHKPCERRKREEHDGVTMDWCYAIGFEEAGDMPCEYCVDHPEMYKNQ